MASFEKVAKSGQRTFQERHQPEARRTFGFLEKKKDYKIRSRAFQEKRNRLKKLRKKALNRNPDEFCFHMINSEMQDGLHYEKEKPEEHTEAQLKLMKTQDANYINHKLNTELKKIEKLKSTLQLLEVDERPPNTHTFYVDSKSEAKHFDVAKKLNTHPMLLDRTYNRLTLDMLRKVKLDNDPEHLEKASRQNRQMYNELSQRYERAEELLALSQKLDVKKKLLDKKNPPAKLVKEGTKLSAPIYVWKKERKR